jgi:outer membrane protein, heavy metal efflux system
MRQTILVRFLLIWALAPLGCSSPDPFDDWTNADLADRAQSYVTEGTEPTYLNRPVPPLDPDVRRGVEGYVGLALQRNPEISAAAQKVQRLQERIALVSSLDDPMVTISGGEMAETAAGQVEYVAGVSQRVPFPGKLGARGRIAEREVAVAAAELETVRLRVAGDVRRAYWRYYTATRGVEVTERSKGLVASFRDAAEAKLRAGRAHQDDVLRASVELTDLDARIVRFKQQQDSAAAMLNSLLDYHPRTELPPPPPIEFARLSLEIGDLLRRSQTTNPQIAAARERMAGYRERLVLARLDSKPDFLVGFSYGGVDSGGLTQSANGDDQWWLTLGVTLPIWADKQDAARREALRGVGETLSGLRAAQNRVAYQVQDSLSRVAAQQQLVVLFADRMLPEAQQTVDVSLSGYRAGRVDFLTLIDNWQQLLRFELIQQQNLSQMQSALADLREATGGELTAAADPSTEYDQQTKEAGNE